ncbi:MAG TPA: TMEM175 family protein [Dyella sp.]|uniref:TMEM175 family protein n=1 Tax=Dyella sp. TaxID=1869338 RepID=UPI002C87094B|nr:TMEM175 family protein [Dyella sp.]HTV86950.1 TMEM175 family protein [Dyella sp.]
MEKGRLEAFSDGVLAIIITIMVLELKVPHGDGWDVLLPQWPVFLSYVLSFIYVGIYWNNHHHFLHAAEKVNGGVLWANLNLLFWLSLMPVATGWMGENHFARLPVALYGVVLLMSAIAWMPLQYCLIAANGGPDSLLAQAVGRDWKGKLAATMYLIGILLAFLAPWVSCLLYATVAAIWFIPDRRIESRILK